MPKLVAIVLIACAGFSFPTVVRAGGAPAPNEAPVMRDDPLPFAYGEHFESLDDYLAHLEELSVRDIPWYQLQEDGTYRLMVPFNRPTDQQTVFTRPELLERFGFDE